MIAAAFTWQYAPLVLAFAVLSVAVAVARKETR